jgi:hypothetical protein
VVLKEISWQIVDLAYLTQNRNQVGAYMNSIWNIVFHKRREITCLYEQLLASEEGPCSMELVIAYTGRHVTASVA